MCLKYKIKANFENSKLKHINSLFLSCVITFVI